MITRKNIKDVINNIDIKDKERIASSDKDYVVIELNICNAGYNIIVTLTNDYINYEYVINNGNCILSIDDPIFDDIMNL